VGAGTGAGATLAMEGENGAAGGAAAAAAELPPATLPGGVPRPDALSEALAPLEPGRGGRAGAALIAPPGKFFGMVNESGCAAVGTPMLLLLLLLLPPLPAACMLLLAAKGARLKTLLAPAELLLLLASELVEFSGEVEADIAGGTVRRTSRRSGWEEMKPPTRREDQTQPLILLTGNSLSDMAMTVESLFNVSLCCREHSFQ